MTVGPRPKELLLHIVDRATWERARDEDYYLAASLQTEGFVHCSTRAQVLATADRHFAGRDDLMVLWIDSDLTGVRLRWEEAAHGEVYPHLFGPLPRRSIVDSTPLHRGEDGRFLPLTEG